MPELHPAAVLKAICRAGKRSVPGLTDRDGLAQALREIIESPQSETREKIAALKELRQLLGLGGSKDGAGDLRRLSTEELAVMIRDYVAPVLELAETIGVAGEMPEHAR